MATQVSTPDSFKATRAATTAVGRTRTVRRGPVLSSPQTTNLNPADQSFAWDPLSMRRAFSSQGQCETHIDYMPKRQEQTPALSEDTAVRVGISYRCSRLPFWFPNCINEGRFSSSRFRSFTNATRGVRKKGDIFGIRLTNLLAFPGGQVIFSRIDSFFAHVFLALSHFPLVF